MNSTLDAAATSADYLAAVESAIERELSRFPGSVADSASEAVRAGGKRLRPLLVYAAAAERALGDSPVAVGAAVECIHTASLIHDDVLDASATRRGRPTVAAASGADHATRAGDLLFSIAFAIVCRSCGDQAIAVVQRLAAAARQLAVGEARQSSARGRFDVSLEEYLERCTDKTGILFGTALACGAVSVGLAAHTVDRLERFGTLVGTAFQIVDDLLDIDGDEAALGKPAMADLAAGHITLPLLLCAQRTPGFAERAAQTPPAELRAVVRDSGVVDECRLLADSLLGQAAQILDELGDAVDRDLLARLASAAVSRSF